MKPWPAIAAGQYSAFQKRYRCPQKRLSMRKTREVRRLHFDLKLQQRQIARSANSSRARRTSMWSVSPQRACSPTPAERSNRDLDVALFPIDRRLQEPLATRTLWEMICSRRHPHP
jgi:hypothetical protein